MPIIPLTWSDQIGEAELVEPGEVIQRWDYIVQIDSIDTYLPSEIEHLRRRGDALADDLVEYLDLRPGG